MLGLLSQVVQKQTLSQMGIKTLFDVSEIFLPKIIKIC